MGRIAFPLIGVIALQLATASAGQNPPTFRARVESIEVDVRVTDDDGRVVRGLTREDFAILDGGVPQTIASLTFVDLAVASPITRLPANNVESDVSTNAGVGRMWVMLLSGYGERARLVARSFVEQAIGPNDQVAVIHVDGNMSAAQGFTRSRQALLASIDRLGEEASNPGLNVERNGFRVLEDVSKRLDCVSGGRKSVIFFDPPSVFIPDFKETNSLFDQRDALRAATRNNVAVYVVSTPGLSTQMGLGICVSSWPASPRGGNGRRRDRELQQLRRGLRAIRSRQQRVSCSGIPPASNIEMGSSIQSTSA